MKRIGIIGVGNMGGALAAGIRKNAPEIEMGMLDQDTQKAKNSAEQYRGEFFADYARLTDFADLIIIAVKPQQLVELFAKIGKLPESKHIISIAAGKKISFFREGLGIHNVARLMPTIAAIAGTSPVGVSFPEGNDGSSVSETFREEVLFIASSIGNPFVLPEKLLSAFTGLSGSGIAYILSFLHALSLGGTEQGIPYEQSLNIAIETMEGACTLLKYTRENPAALITKVTSAGGTTIMGIKELEKGNFTHTVMRAVDAAAKKAESFEQNF